jgi:hypothetical protein
LSPAPLKRSENERIGLSFGVDKLNGEDEDDALALLAFATITTYSFVLFYKDFRIISINYSILNLIRKLPI